MIWNKRVTYVNYCHCLTSVLIQKVFNFKDKSSSTKIYNKKIHKGFKPFKNIRYDCTDVLTQQAADFGKQGIFHSQSKTHIYIFWLQ